MTAPLKVRYRDRIGWDLDGISISDTIKHLKNQEKNILKIKGVTKVLLSFDDEEWGEGYNLFIIGYGHETEAEKLKREEEAAEIARRRAQRERAEFERLSKKFS